MAVETGQDAPDFALRDQDRAEHTLSAYRGTPVLLVFYPFTFTSVCEGELCALRDGFDRFESAGVQVMAVSCDSVPAQKVWAEQQGWQFPVLSDFWPHGRTAQAYGVFNEALGCANRATFLIGPDGRVVDEFASDGLGTARDPERYAEALAKL